MIKSKLTSKAQTTIPQPVRAALGLREGDELAYVIKPGRVILMRARAAAGLPAPSVVRSAKITTIERQNAERIGRLPQEDRSQVAAALLESFAHLGRVFPDPSR